MQMEAASRNAPIERANRGQLAELEILRFCYRRGTVNLLGCVLSDSGKDRTRRALRERPRKAASRCAGTALRPRPPQRTGRGEVRVGCCGAHGYR